ncbi:hypothetical protein TNCV_972061 [Trichonephila clavipes]|nr:hypothetical protein TNCV_972061 [Trichonephila clavipes]
MNRRSFLGIWTVKQSSIPCHDKSLMRGMVKVVVYILLSGMMAIGRLWNSGGVAMVLHLGILRRALFFVSARSTFK